MSDCFCTKTYQCLACERQEEVNAGRIAARKVAECGTRAGYNRHLKLKEPTCAECKAAQNRAVQKFLKGRTDAA